MLMKLVDQTLSRVNSSEIELTVYDDDFQTKAAWLTKTGRGDMLDSFVIITVYDLQGNKIVEELHQMLVTQTLHGGIAWKNIGTIIWRFSPP